MKKILLWSLLIIVFLGVAGFTYIYKKLKQDIPVPPLSEVSSIADIVAPYMTNEMTKGLSIGTYQNGQVAFHNFGVASDKNPVLPTEKSIYEIGSITKTFTGTVLAALAVEGKVKYNDPISKFLPDSVCNWSADKSITLEELATHTSGLPRIPNNLMKSLFTDIDNPYRNYGTEELYAFLKEYEPKAKTKRKNEYSNLGFGLLGHILATVNQTTFEEMMTQHIFQPLAMNQSSAVDNNNLIQGHDALGQPISQWDFQALAGAGAIRSSVTDMMQYLQANIEEKTPFQAAQIPRKAMNDFQKIGLGWISQQNDDLSFTWHNGGTGGYRTFMGFSKDQQVGVVVLSNATQSVDGIGVRTLEFLAK
ncbi:MAG: serine hydrolase domain-containing protein [Bacteroidota bacterium]